MPRPRPDTSVEKRCCACKETKPRDQFYKSKRTFDGLQTNCRACHAARRAEWGASNKETTRRYSKAWRAANPRLAKDYKLKTAYGIPLGTYDRMLASQRGLCAICGSPDPFGRGDFHVDHCHDTGAVRGLLCAPCNTGIGQLGHSVERLQLAVDYLSRK